MLPRAHRLRRSTDFQRVYERGRTFAGTALLIRVRRTRSLAPTRIGIVVGKKVSKKATARNRLRRQLRAISQDIVKAQPDNLDIVMNVRPIALTKTYAELQGECQALLQRLLTTLSHSSPTT